MRFALIGCGRIAVNHIRAALENKLAIAAICDIDPARMEGLLQAYNLQTDASIRRYTDYKIMLRETAPALTAIATESGKHAQIALTCMEAGCHVIIEKPIALSMADADAIVAAGKEKGVKVCACHQNRFNQSIQHLRGAVEAGRFGKLSHGSVHVRWNRNEGYYAQAPWRGTRAQDGGALMNQSIHGIDLLRWMMGNEIDEVFAYTRRQFHPYLECEDVGLAVVKFKNGAIGAIEGTTNVFPENLEETLYIFGQNGTVKVGGKSCNTIDVWEFAGEEAEDAALKNGLREKTENVYGNGHAYVYADMLAAIKENRPPYITGEDGRRALELVLAIYKSAGEGRPVQLPLRGFSTKDMQGYGF
ncbi:MAG: Gfo/Idh/MocA family oxidoreductase [Clostridiales bacterium]|jgi:predicted dehydrogenase|nr:Gfo/Idh/MocA family oxidoreductase [Clostridiales bacterium]